jgi:ribosomal protein S6--L-glutamate ligase
MKIVILSQTPQSKLVEAGAKRGHEMIVINPDNLYLFISNKLGYHRIYNKEERVLLKDIDAIIPRIGKNLIPHGVAVVRQFELCFAMYTTGSANGLRAASDKFECAQVCSAAKVRQPKTIMASEPDNPSFLIEKVGGLPSVAKLVRGSQGNGVMILESKLAANTALESLYKLKAELLLQEFLQANSKDIRAIVVGDKVVSAMERTANKDDFRANISKGGTAKAIELTAEEKDMAIKVAKALNLDFVGVDIIREGSTSYVIEANGNPGEKIITHTGYNHYVDLIKLLEDKVGKKGSPKATIESSAITHTQFDSEAHNYYQMGKTLREERERLLREQREKLLNNRR